METHHTIQYTTLPKATRHDTNIGFWANYWHVSPKEMQDIITMLGSSSYLKIDSYMKERKASA